MNHVLKRPKRILLSATDKNGLEKLAKIWSADDVELVASGGTASYLREKGFSVTDVSVYSKNPEAFGGRMKTLSFPIFSGVLFKRDSDDDEKQRQELGVPEIDGIVCNFYPFDQVLKEKKYQVNEETLFDLIENIDIGGPSMVRAAAKNYRHTFVLTHPSQYDRYLSDYQSSHGEISLKLSFQLSLEAFQLTTEYDRSITDAFHSFNSDKKQVPDKFDATEHFDFKASSSLRYGENSHQKAIFMPFSERLGTYGLSDFNKIQGKELSYNNYLDIDSSLRSLFSVYQFSQASIQSKMAISIIKHQNPCGLSTSVKNSQVKLSDLLEVSWSCDPVSSFGSIIAFSHEVDMKCAEFLSDKFVEVIVAPSFSDEALRIFSQKKNLRLLEYDRDKFISKFPKYDFRSILGGFLAQESDQLPDEKLELVTNVSSSQDLELYQFALSCAKSLKSNAIALACKSDFNEKIYQMIGAGMGNPNRLVSFHQALEKAKENGLNDFSQVVLASDAFFPFDDIVKLAAQEGVREIIQPGGSIRDKEIIKSCNDLGLSMTFTGKRHFAH